MADDFEQNGSSHSTSAFCCFWFLSECNFDIWHLWIQY